MANAWYPKFKERVLGLGCGSGSIATGTLKAALVDTGTYTYSAAHDFFDDITGVVGTPTAIGSPTFTNGVLDGGDVTFTAVSGASAEAIVIFLDTAGASSTDPLVLYLDTGQTGLPVTPNGGDITIVWNASGVAKLGT